MLKAPLEKQQVYLMKNSQGIYKIGVSETPEKRRMQVQGACGYKVALLASWTITGTTAKRVEKALHDYYKVTRLEGEWFGGVCEEKVAVLVREFEVTFSKEAVPYNWVAHHKRMYRKAHSVDIDNLLRGGGWNICYKDKLIALGKTHNSRPYTLKQGLNRLLKYNEDSFRNDTFPVIQWSGQVTNRELKLRREIAGDPTPFTIEEVQVMNRSPSRYSQGA